MRKKRVAIFYSSLDCGGAEGVLTNLANGFNKAGLIVDMVLAKRSGYYLSELESGVNVVDLSSSSTMYSLLPLIKYLRKTRPDAMLSTQAHVNVIAVIARTMARVPTRLAVREATMASIDLGHTGGVRAKLISFVLKRIYEKADAIIAPSLGVANDLIEKFGIAKPRVSVISNPLEISRIQSLAMHSTLVPFIDANKTPLIVAVGRLDPVKDFSTLIHAFAKVAEKTQARLLILGEGGDRDILQGLISSLGLQGYVTMPGFVKNPFAYMKQASVFVLSSRYEGLPNTILQALAVGTPVVATDCPSGPREILEGERWGRLVPVGDVEAMSKAIVDGIEGRLKKPPMSSLEERYGIEIITQKYFDVLFDGVIGTS